MRPSWHAPDALSSARSSPLKSQSNSLSLGNLEAADPTGPQDHGLQDHETAGVARFRSRGLVVSQAGGAGGVVSGGADAGDVWGGVVWLAGHGLVGSFPRRSGPGRHAGGGELSFVT